MEKIFAPENQETTVNGRGGLQSALPGAFYQLPGKALKRLRMTWIGKSLTREGHVEAAFENLIELLQDNHDADFLCRAFTHLAWAVECETHVDTVQVGSEDGFPYAALTRIAIVMGEGAKKYARGNWRLIEYSSQIDHVLQHICALGSGDDSDDHLGHALTRCAFAIEVEDPEYRFSGIDPVAPKLAPLNVAQMLTLQRMADAKKYVSTLVATSNEHFAHVSVVRAIRAAMLLGDMTFLGELSEPEWKAFTSGPMLHEFARREHDGAYIALVDGQADYESGEKRHSFGVGAFIGERPEFDGN